MVNEHFWLKHNDESGLYRLTLINLPGELSRKKTEADIEIGKILNDVWYVELVAAVNLCAWPNVKCC